MTLATLPVKRPGPRISLRHVLAFDGLTCLLMGVLLVASAAPLSELLGLAQQLLFVAGLVLLPSAALMFVAARQSPPARALVTLIVAGNVAWVAASVLVAVLASPTVLGLVFLLLQAAAVAVLAGLEQVGLRAA
ncbi:MAG TPA: hypothetical protein VNO84_02145 [Burkholderiaceae bacterium]|nr:hypothetical protein [Burkholderiaceae bacterium]